MLLFLNLFNEGTKMKKKITRENVLCAFLVLCPILDIASFWFRNTFHTSVSISTFIRPIIPIVMIMYLFLKEKIKKKLTIFAFVYGLYAIVHLWLFQMVKTGASYSGVIHEFQYIVNYSFMILNLFLYGYVFKKKESAKLRFSILVSTTIYIVSIFLAIVTKTSSSTYIEGMGYKGWFESGNSISAILTLSLFILLNGIKEKKYRYWVIGVTILIGTYLTILIGTRVGLFGFILAILFYASVEIFISMIHKTQLNRKIIIGAVVVLSMVAVIVVIVGSNTLQRRKHLQDIEGNIIDQATNEPAHISGSLLEIKEKIERNELEEGYLSEAGKKSILELYDFCNRHKVVNNDMRTQQLIYNVLLVKNQANPLLLLFGNGYMANYRELVMEMEIPAFLLNFGLIGFCLYFVPFLAIFLRSAYWAIKNRAKIDTEHIMLLAGLFLSFALAFLSGYTFFNSSTMMFIVVISVLLQNKQK